MAVDNELAAKVLQEIDRDELAQLGCDLANIPSPTGQEKDIAEFILDWYQQNGAWIEKVRNPEYREYYKTQYGTQVRVD